MRPGQPADLFHMFPGERGESSSLSTQQLLKKKKRKDKDSWQVLGFRDPAKKARVQRKLRVAISHLRLHHIHHSRDFMVVSLRCSYSSII